jgi:competence protein ComEA
MGNIFHQLQHFDYDAFFFRNRYYIFIILLGVILIGLGVFASKKGLTGSSKVVVSGGTQNSSSDNEIVAEIAGEVVKPAVYKLADGSRVEDLLVMAGGLTADADRTWVDKNLNRAAKITDGQKIYIPPQSMPMSAKNSGEDQTISTVSTDQGSVLININSASAKELGSLPGIGPVYAQNIIDHRPYSTVDDLVSKKVVSAGLLNKIKDKISVY